MLTKSTSETIELEHYQTQSVRNAIARQIARDVKIPDELIAAKIEMDKAVEVYNQQVHLAVHEFLKRF